MRILLNTNNEISSEITRTINIYFFEDECRTTLNQ